MKLKLKSWLIIALAGLMLILGILIPNRIAHSQVDVRTLHLLNRITYGASPGDIEQVQSMGVKNYIQSQLSPETVPQSPQLKSKISQFRTLNLTPVQLFAQYQPNQNMNPQQREKARKRAGLPRQEAMKVRLVRSIYSSRQLQEVMVDFWLNHFNVFAGKGHTRLWVGNYTEKAIAPHALGKFRDLLGATAHHPAMLFYLDNDQNTAPNSPGGRRRKSGLNENYARELMELHTLGVDGGYTQEDVITLARILTGWGIDRQGKFGNSGFRFFRNRHDPSNKVFLGNQIQGGGMEEGERALDILARHPSTARFISYKLAQYFVVDNPPNSLVNRLAQRFQATDGNIREVLATLFDSPEFWDSKYYGSKFKTPYEYIVSAVRATGVKKPELQRLVGNLHQLGMRPYYCETPDGYPNTQDAWLNPDAMMRRIGFAYHLANNGVSEDSPENATQVAKTLGNNFSGQTLEVLENSPKRFRVSLLLGSPEMMRR